MSPILNILRGNKPSQIPIWVMRQAGRYLPEYCMLREKAKSFKNLYLTPELAVEVTMMPLKRFPLDAAIIFSDILIALDAIGVPVNFETNKGPVINNPINSDSALQQLSSKPDLDKYDFLAQSLRGVKQELGTTGAPLIGFVGSPWTLAAYAVEGEGSKVFAKLRKMMYAEPQLLHKLLQRLTTEVSELALMQIKNGADIIQIFDSWASLLNDNYYRAFSLRYITQIINNIKSVAPQTPIILFAKGTPLMPQEMAKSNPDCLGIDWQTDLASAFNQVGESVALQGNMDPAALYADKQLLDKEIENVIAACPKDGRHIFNLGHGIYPDTNPDKVAYLVDKVHDYN